MKEKVRYSFNTFAPDYDRLRKIFIPCYEDFYGIPLTIMNQEWVKPEILDLGSGTGLFSAFVLEKYPQAGLTLIDISEDMLAVARSRFRGLANVDYIAEDYVRYDFGEVKYDAIISALSIHHLEDREKFELYKKCYCLLKAGGIFINAEQVLAGTMELEQIYLREWKRQIQESGLAAEDALAVEERRKLDQEATVESQLQWLREAGFRDVDCVYRYYKFAVIIARKALDG
jgi:Methylase involved in ubiquinone/menaquinone biosynthesis